MYKYPGNLKCAGCGKESGDHNAMTRACPIGRAHRGFYSFSNTESFVPKMPALKGKAKETLAEYNKALIAVTVAEGALTSEMVDRLNHAKFQLATLLE